ncbi:MAG: tetratricopeptide repeat protein [Bacteroidota bacterium]
MSTTNEHTELLERIDAYVKGNLTANDEQALWEELALYPEWIETLETELGVYHILTRAKESEQRKAPAPVRRIPSFAWPLSTAAIVLLVLGIQLFRVPTPTELNEFIVERIEPSQMEVSQAVRSEGAPASTADSLLNAGFEAALAGNYEKAEQAYQQVIELQEEASTVSRAHLNTGIIRYNEGAFAEASTLFEQTAAQAEEGSMIAEKAYWYWGNSLVNLGKLEEGRAVVYQAYQMDGLFRDDAFLLILKLNVELGNSDVDDQFRPAVPQGN